MPEPVGIGGSVPVDSWTAQAAITVANPSAIDRGLIDLDSEIGNCVLIADQLVERLRPVLGPDLAEKYEGAADAAPTGSAVTSRLAALRAKVAVLSGVLGAAVDRLEV